MNNIVKIQNHDVAVIEWNNERVVTSAQLAELYETDTDNIKKNFERNRDRFQEEKHFYLLKGEELKEFKHYVTNSHLVGERTPHLYLWTQRGASRHCKMLGTDKSWDVFDCLEESYFNPRMVISDLSPQTQALINIELRQNRQEKALQEVKGEMQAVRDIVTLNPNAWRSEAKNLIVRIARQLGGNEYIKDVNAEVYKLLNERFGVDLGIRLINLRRRMADEGVCKSKRDKTNKVDVIAADKKLIEGYLIIIKEMAIKYGVTEVA